MFQAPTQALGPLQQLDTGKAGKRATVAAIGSLGIGGHPEDQRSTPPHKGPLENIKGLRIARQLEQK